MSSWMALMCGAKHVPACLGLEYGQDLLNKHCPPIITRVAVLSEVQRPGSRPDMLLPLVHGSKLLSASAALMPSTCFG